jgi:putative ABC transport system permease protein
MLKIAFEFMWYDKPKMIGILAGIIISVFLIGQQLGIFTAMLGNMKGLARFNTDYVWVLSNKTENSMQLQTMDARVGRELISVPGVVSASPLVVVGGSAKLNSGTRLAVQLVGISSPYFIGGPKVLLGGASDELLLNEGAVFADKTDQALMDNIQVGDYFQINDRRVYLAGFTKGNAGFGASYVYTTIERARTLGNFSLDMCNVFLVKFDTTNFSEQQIIQYINTNFPNIKAWDAPSFANATIAYMMRTSSIAVSFGMMVIFAIIAGFAIVGLTLYSSVNDRIRDYGTIKAIGGNNALISKLILYQAFIYAVIGYSIAYAMLYGFKMILSGGKLEINYSAAIITFLIMVTLTISVIGSMFALQKIVKLEPVEIFRM